MAQSGLSFSFELHQTSNQFWLHFFSYHLGLNLAGHSPSKPTLYHCAEASWPLIGSLILASRLFIPYLWPGTRRGVWAEQRMMPATLPSIFVRKTKTLASNFGRGGGNSSLSFGVKANSASIETNAATQRERREWEREWEWWCVCGGCKRIRERERVVENWMRDPKISLERNETVLTTQFGAPATYARMTFCWVRHFPEKIALLARNELTLLTQ